MRARNCLVVGSLALALSACGGSVPMIAITQNGHTFRGELTAPTFQISDGRVTCSGKFPAIFQSHPNYTLPIHCNHGLTGIVVFGDLATLRNGGGGILRLSDGTEGTFITGDGAAAF